MISIIYVNHKPLLCFDKTPVQALLFIKEISIKKYNAVHYDCILKNKLEQHDISNYKPWKKTSGKIKPIWFENDCGKQITFLIE